MTLPVIIILILTLASVARTAEAVSFGDSLVVVFTGGMRGRADGCGCSSGPEGGLDRRATLLKQFLGQTPYFALDCGGILDLDPARGLARSRCTFQGLARTGLKAISVGSRDLFYGPKFLKELASQSGIALLSLNIVEPDKPDRGLFDRWMVFEFQGIIIGVTGISQPVQPERTAEFSRWSSIPTDSLGGILASTHPSQAQITILLTDLDEASLRRLLNKTDVFDIALTSSPQVYSATPFAVGNCLVQRPEHNGRTFEAMIIPRGDSGKSTRFIKQTIARTTPADPETAAWLEECLGKSPPNMK